MSATTGLRPAPQRRKEAPINVVASIPFLVVHLGCFLVLWTGFSAVAALPGVVTPSARMFGLTGGFHRYFCHKTYRTSRVFQFVLAALGTAAAQMGPLWWTGHHRHHHAHADTDEDVHPPGVKGFFWAHAGWGAHREHAYPFISDAENEWMARHFFSGGIMLSADLLSRFDDDLGIVDR